MPNDTVDFEAISDALGVEINSELSPARLHRILKQRIDAMTTVEAASVGGGIWQQVKMLDVNGDLMRKAATPTGMEAHHEWVNVVALPPQSFLLLPIADTKDFSEQLTEKPMFADWVASNGLQVVEESNGVIISGDHLAGLSETFVSKVIASF